MGFDLSALLIKKKKYNKLVCLGHNCEIAFAISANELEIESGMFNWVFVHKPELINDFIINPEELFSKGGEFTTDGSFYLENRFKFGIHLKHIEGDGITFKDYEDEIIERTQYLKSKFFKLLNSNHSLLFIHKINITLPEEDEYNFIVNFLQIMREKYPQLNFELLVLIEKSTKFKKISKIKDKKLYIRKLKRFSPLENALDIHKPSWNKLFQEFSDKKNRPKLSIYKKLLLLFKIVCNRMYVFENLREVI